MERWTTSSHVVHLPCCDCCTAFVTRSLSISLLLSRIISSALIAEQDSPFCEVVPTYSLMAGLNRTSHFLKRQFWNWFISSYALNFLFVLNSGLTSRILMSAELFSIHCVLILETLYSSTIDLRGSLNFALLLCNGNSRNVSCSKPSLHCRKRPWEGALYKWLTRSASDAMHMALYKWSTRK